MLEERALFNKVNRGRFTCAFALQAMAALDMEVLNPSRSGLPEAGVGGGLFESTEVLVPTPI